MGNIGKGTSRDYGEGKEKCPRVTNGITEDPNNAQLSEPLSGESYAIGASNGENVAAPSDFFRRWLNRRSQSHGIPIDDNLFAYLISQNPERGANAADHTTSPVGATGLAAQGNQAEDPVTNG
ncbi:hypothetical protein ElyMa_002360600, partial [Elysia marginata]